MGKPELQRMLECLRVVGIVLMTTVAAAQPSGPQRREPYRPPPGGAALPPPANPLPELPQLAPPGEPPPSEAGGESHDEGTCNMLSVAGLCVCIPHGAGHWRFTVARAERTEERDRDMLERDDLPKAQLHIGLVENAVRSCSQTEAMVATFSNGNVITAPAPFTAAARSVKDGAYFDSLCLELGGSRVLLIATGSLGPPEAPEYEPLRAMVQAVAEAARTNRTSCTAPPPACAPGDPTCSPPPTCPSEDPSCGSHAQCPGFDQSCGPFPSALVVSRVELAGFTAEGALGAALGLSYLNPNIDSEHHAGFAHGGRLAVGYDKNENILLTGEYGIGFGVGGKRVALGPLVGGSMITLSGGQAGSFKIPPRPGYFLAGFLRAWAGDKFGFELHGARHWLLGATKAESANQNQSAYDTGFVHETEFSGHLLLFDPDSPKSIGVGYADFGDGSVVTLIVGFGL